jgi:phosphopentomutase
LRRPAFTRVILLVIDSAGIGELPDAAVYGDEGSNTIGNIAREVGMSLPYLRSLGLGRVVALGGEEPPPRGAYGRMAEASAGKDSVTGHWEMAGVVLDRPFPTFPHGFPADVIAEFERRIGRATLGNVVASGTEIIERLGDEHVRTGKPIVYTSADSVFQIAAHEEVIPIAEQYRMCEAAFDLVGRGHGVGRVIARPFVGASGAYRRTSNRHDYALEPAGVTLLDALTSAGQSVVTIGKVRDLFAGRGITRALTTVSDTDGLATLERTLGEVADGLVFVNLVDSDTQYGHRNDVAGYAANLERIDAGAARVADALGPGDLLVVTADHGNDPTTPSTDHSREHVPLLVAGRGVPAGRDLGTRATFADLGQTIADNFGVGPLAHGTSFLTELRQ